MEANALEGADVIYLQAEQYNLTIGEINENKAFGGDLDIVESVSIIGKGNTTTTVSGNSQFRIFSILRKNNSFPEVSISDIKMTQGIPDQIGAVIVNNSILSLNNVIVEHAGSDPSLTMNTPAIYSLNSMLEISNSTIQNNDQGIFSENSRVIIENSLFKNNKHLVKTATEQGAAIYADNNFLFITSTVFSNNSSLSSGGAIYAKQSEVTLNKNDFNSNKASEPNSSTYTYGGAIVLARSVTSIEGSTFQDNIAYGAGGAIYNFEGDLFINKSKYINNSAVHDSPSIGGAIAIQGFAEEKKSNIVINESIIAGNNSSFGGGGIGSISNSNTLEEIQIQNSQISGNTATLGAGFYLGGVQKTDINNTTISGNTASDSGGGIYFGDFSVSELNLTNITVAYNEALEGANTYNKSGKINIVNSIMSNALVGDNCSGSLNTLGSNISSDSSCSFDTSLDDMLMTNPLLFPLADNGGSTKTHALPQNSKAINNGDNSFCNEFFAVDQRYYYRADGLCDIGAFEQNSALANRGTLSFITELSEVNETEQLVTVTVSRKDGSDTAISAFIFDSNKGTAAANQDYYFINESLFWTDGDTEDKEMTFPINNDTLKSENKTVILQLYSPSNGVALSPYTSHKIEILDDESLPGVIEFSKSSYVVGEDNKYAQLELVRKNGSSGEITVHIETNNGTAISGQDYMGGTLEHTFLDGEMTKQVNVIIDNGWDNYYEDNKEFYISISAANEQIIGDTSTATIVIIDDEEKPENPGRFSFELNEYKVNENITTLNIQITRDNGTDGDMVLYLIASNDTAEFGSDVLAIANQDTSRLRLLMPAGKESFTLPLSINNDILEEGNESMTLTLLNPQGGAELGEIESTIITIFDDDTPKSTLSFGEASYSTSEDNEHIVVEIVRTANSSGNTDITVNAVNGTALNSSDFSWEPTKIQFIDGQSSYALKVDISKANNSIADGNKTFTLNLSNPQNGILGNVSSTTITLVDNDSISSIPDDKSAEETDNKPTGEANNKLSTSKGAASLSYAYLLFVILFLLRRNIFKKI